MLFLNNFWNYLVLSAPFFLGGLLLAGIIKFFIPLDKIKKTLGGRSSWTFIKAAILGIPLPLCSCSVVPTAITLRKAGANNAATSSFIIATPESGIDSIAFTYAIMDLPMTILRPIAALSSALVAGFFQLLLNNDRSRPVSEMKECSHCCGGDKGKAKTILQFAFGELVDDIALWMFIGVGVGALIETLVPGNFFGGLNGMSGKVLMLLVGIPIYICASSSTPLVAALILKGMSPGTALILLLTGPATNIANLLVLRKYIGTKGIVINIVIIAVVALIFGVLTDWLYSYFAWEINFRLMQMEHGITIWGHLLALVLLVLLIKGIWIKEVGPRLHKEQQCH